MLFEKSAAVGDIVSFKLIDGEELTGKMTTQSDGGITVSRPVGVSIQMISPQQAGISFMPFMASIPDEVSVFFPAKNLLTSPIKTRQDVANQYIRATSSIEVPTKPGLIGL